MSLFNMLSLKMKNVKNDLTIMIRNSTSQYKQINPF